MDHFIETVRKYPCLWNTTAIEYRDQELKDAAWAEVMKETDLSSVKEVKLKWKKLRDSYRDALKRQSEMLAKDGPAKKAYPWKYMGLMQFLQPYMSARKKPAEPAPAANGAGSSDSSDSSSSSPKRKPPGGGGGGGGGGRLSVLERRLDYLCQGQGPPPLAGKRRDPLPHPLAHPLPHPHAPAPDPLDIFFNSMCQSTKRFPFPTQIRIKRRLFEAVMEAEEALVAEQQTYASLWARAPASSSSSDDTDERKPS